MKYSWDRNGELPHPDKYFNGYTLSSGRKFGAHGGMIGIDLDGVAWGNEFELTVHPCDDDENIDYEPPEGPFGGFTADERREIAEEAIRRWQAWGDLPGSKR